MGGTILLIHESSYAGDLHHDSPPDPLGPASPFADSWRIQRVCAMFLGPHAVPVSRRSRRR
jgi:hypothetical protein